MVNCFGWNVVERSSVDGEADLGIFGAAVAVEVGPWIKHHGTLVLNGD